MNPISTRLLTMEESATLAMSRKSRELIAQGKDVISLSLGEPDFDTPQFIKEAAKKAIDDNFSHYTPVPGYLELRQAIARKFKRDNQLEYSPEEIVVSTGAKQSIANVVLSLVNPGEEVIVPAPYWVSYIQIVQLAEGKPVVVHASIEQDFKITATQLEKAITPKTKLMIFSSPCNPTGSVYSKEELASIADVVKKHGIFVIADEIYEHINFGKKHTSLASFSSIRDQVITVNGVSKAFAMTGWRLGFIGAPKFIAAACDKIQGQITSATCSITQRAVIAAMDADPKELKEMIAAFHQRRDLVLSLLGEIKGVKTNIPEGAFYVFPDVSYFFGKSYKGRKINNADELSVLLLEKGWVALVTGEAFGDSNCLRISYAAAEETLIKAIGRIKDVLDNIQ
jgi:aspartate aminotransferase